MPAETDWKKFRTMVPTLRERYLTACNARLAALLTHPQKTETERFWETQEEVDRESQILQRCLDGHSRSNMWLSLGLMARHGMLKREDAAVFTPELQQYLEPIFTDTERPPKR